MTDKKGVPTPRGGKWSKKPSKTTPGRKPPPYGSGYRDPGMLTAERHNGRRWVS